MLNTTRLINELERERKKQGFTVIADGDVTRLHTDDFAVTYVGDLPRELLGYLVSCTGTIPRDCATYITTEEYGQTMLMSAAKECYRDRFDSFGGEGNMTMQRTPLMLLGAPLYQQEGRGIVVAVSSRQISILETEARDNCRKMDEHDLLVFGGDGWEYKTRCLSDLNGLDKLAGYNWQDAK